MLPEWHPKSVHGAFIKAAAVLREEHPKETMLHILKRHGPVQMFCKYQCPVYLVVGRNFEDPPSPSRYDSEPKSILGQFEKTKVFLT